MKHGLAVGTEFKESQDGETFLKASASDFASAAEVLLKVKVVISEMENPEQKKVCALVVQNFENWLVAIGQRSKLKAVGISRFETDS